MREAENLLARKLRHDGVARSPLPDTDFVGETFARQAERALRALVKTGVSAIVLECKVVKVAEAVRDIAVPTMLGLIEIENGKVQGLLNLDTDFAYHLIDLMLGGDASIAPVPITRTFTEIDMALCRLAHEGLLGAFTEALAACFGRPPARALQLAGQRQDIAQLRFAPEHVDVLVYDIALDIGGAARAGNMRLVLPLAMLDVICAILRDEGGVRREEPSDLWGVTMRHAALGARVAIDAVAQRRRMAVSDVMRLGIGDLLELPPNALTDIQLMMAQPGGRRAAVASGRLGTYQGEKVVKLDVAIDPRVRESLRMLWPPAEVTDPSADPLADRAATLTAGAAGEPAPGPGAVASFTGRRSREA